MIWTLVVPLILAIALVAALEYGGAAWLWGCGAFVTIGFAIFTLFQPEILLYYKGPLNAAGLFTVSFPFTAAAVTIVVRLLYRPRVPVAVRLFAAIVMAIIGFGSYFWIA